MAEFNNYSFSNVNVIFGSLQLQGFAEGDDVVNIEPETEQFMDMAGAKGDVVRSQTNDNRATVTVRLLQNSGSNAALAALYSADKIAGSSVFPMTVEDRLTGETYTLDNAWIRVVPTVTRGQGVNSMDWVFRGDNLRLLLT